MSCAGFLVPVHAGFLVPVHPGVAAGLLAEARRRAQYVQRGLGQSQSRSREPGPCCWSSPISSHPSPSSALFTGCLKNKQRWRTACNFRPVICSIQAWEQRGGSRDSHPGSSGTEQPRNLPLLRPIQVPQAPDPRFVPILVFAQEPAQKPPGWVCGRAPAVAPASPEATAPLSTAQAARPCN